MPGPTTTWIAALLFGAAIVGFNFWFWFDEPSFSTETEYFSRYKPRFSTYYPKYTHARYGYVFTFLGLFIVFSLIPEIFFALIKAAAQVDATATQPAAPAPPQGAQTAVFPIMIALALITFQRAPVTKDVERKIRAFFHAFAKIPDGVRRIVADMGNCDFIAAPDDLPRETNKLRLPATETVAMETVSNLTRDDDIVGVWYRMGFLLDALSRERRNESGIDPLFFDTYENEINTIQAEHVRLADAVRAHLLEIVRNPGLLRPGIVNDSDQPLASELRKLGQRLYTFIACGVQSSVNTELEAATILKRLGCSTHSPVRLRRDVLQILGPIAGLAFVAVMIISVFTTFLTGLFRSDVLMPLLQAEPKWEPAFGVPKDVFGMYIWSWATAFYYGAALLGALAARELRIATRRWSDLNNPVRERPVLRYGAPTLGGSVLGFMILILIALANGPGLEQNVKGFSALQSAILGVLPWFPLALSMALLSIWLVDFGLFEDRYREVALRSILGGLFMGTIGFFSAQIATQQAVALYATQQGLDLSHSVSRAVLYVSLFIALLIAIFSGVLCFIVQFGEIQVGKARRLAGCRFKVISLQSGPSLLTLNGDGTATIMPCSGSSLITAVTQKLTGNWLQFPEGTVVRWIAPSADNINVGDVGLISISDQTLVYEGYEGQIQQEPCVVAHLEPLISPSTEPSSVRNAPVAQHG